MIHEIANFLVEIIGQFGYLGIFILMFIESTFFPFPSEIVMIPAGFLASKGEMNIYFIIFLGILGSIFGALFNYFFAKIVGRKILLKMFSEKKIKLLEDFFKKHGEISTFNGRLIPGIRQLISFPAGLAKMNLAKFSFYTGLGAGIWVIILTMIGFLIGENQEMVSKYLKEITIYALIFIVISSGLYYFYFKNKKIK